MGVAMKLDFFFAKVLAPFALLCFSANVAATGAGTIIMNGKIAAVTDAYAYRHASPTDRSSMLTTIVLTDRPVDDRKAVASDDRDKVFHAQLKQARAVYWEAVLNADGSVKTMNAVWPGGMELRGSGSSSDLHITQNDAKHIEGSYRSLDEQPKVLTGVEFFDLKFSVDF